MNIADLIPNIAQIISLAILVIGILAFCVSIITQVIKNVWVFTDVPTNILVVGLSIAMTTGAFFAVMDFYKLTIYWYMVVAAIILGFFVAFIAMKGWKEFAETFSRFYRKDFDDFNF